MSVDLQQFGYTEGAAAQITVPDTTITALVLDGDTQAVIADYTGNNALHWPAVLTALTAEQRAELLGGIANTIVRMRAGVA